MTFTNVLVGKMSISQNPMIIHVNTSTLHAIDTRTFHQSHATENMQSLNIHIIYMYVELVIRFSDYIMICTCIVHISLLRDLLPPTHQMLHLPICSAILHVSEVGELVVCLAHQVPFNGCQGIVVHVSGFHVVFACHEPRLEEVLIETVSQSS